MTGSEMQKKTKKVAVRCHQNGFDLSLEARFWLRANGALDGVTDENSDAEYFVQHCYEYQKCGKTRHDPLFIRLLEEFGYHAFESGIVSLRLVEIPDDVEYQIERCGDIEWVAEKHRSWGSRLY